MNMPLPTYSQTRRTGGLAAPAAQRPVGSMHSRNGSENIVPRLRKAWRRVSRVFMVMSSVFGMGSMRLKHLALHQPQNERLEPELVLDRGSANRREARFIGQQKLTAQS